MLWLRYFVLFALATAPATTPGEVDRDCFAGQWSVTCALNRVDDAKDADKLFRPIMERHGWSWACYQVQYIRGDAGGPDTLLVIVNGHRGGAAPACNAPSTANKAGAISEVELRKLGRDLKSVLLSAPEPLRRILLRKTGALALGNGYGGEAHLPLP